jgi:hypothetical protein
MTVRFMEKNSIKRMLTISRHMGRNRRLLLTPDYHMPLLCRLKIKLQQSLLRMMLDFLILMPVETTIQELLQ